MQLAKYLIPESILTCLHTGSKDELLRLMSAAIARNPDVVRVGLDSEKVYSAIIDREHIGNTGIGNGFAFPHARIVELDNIVMSLAILADDLEYDSFDHKKVNVACMVLAPGKKPTMALKAVALVAKLFSTPGVTEQLHNAVGGAQVLACINQAELELDAALTAQDIMRQPALAIDPFTPIRLVTQMMSEKQIGFAPVVDSRGRIMGEISCAALFQLGVPEFFTKMKNVGFICDFDPFEKYFDDEPQIMAKDAMAESFCKMPANSTLLEVVFALTVQKYPCVYIVDAEDRLLGCVDECQLLNRVINL